MFKSTVLEWTNKKSLFALEKTFESETTPILLPPKCKGKNTNFF
jgi:hypothetical protein